MYIGKADGFRYRIVLVGVFSVIGAGVASAADKPAPKKLNYQDNILPILREKCLSCHDADKVKGGLDMTSYAKLMEGGSSGAVVKPGDPDGSRLFLTVSHKSQPFMPPKSDRLSDAYLATIQQWILLGALENAGSKAVATKPKADVSLTSVVRGRPPVPPMPTVTLNREPVLVARRADAVTAMATSPWAPLVAIGGQKQVLLYNTDSLDLVGVFPFQYGKPNIVRFSRNGSLLLAGGGRGGQSGKVVVWNISNGERIIDVGDETDTVLAADISPDQTQIALGGPGRLIRVYSTKDGEKIREIKKHTDWITALEFSPDGVLLASADRNGGLFAWEAHTGREYFSLRGHTAAITDVSWRDDSNVLASASEDTTIRLWEMENGGQIRSWGAHGGGVQSVKFSHDGRLVSCGRDRVAKVWDQNGGQQKVFEAFPDLALRSAITHDNARVIAGDWTGLVKLFVVADGKPAGALSPNPPSLADQYEAAMKDLIAKQAAYEQAVAAATAAQSVAAKANADLVAAQQAAATMTTALKNAEAAFAQAKAAADSTKNAVPMAMARIPAKELVAKAFAEALAKVKDAADKIKNDPALAAEVQNCQKLVTQAVAELEAAKKAHADAIVAANAAAAKLGESEKNVGALRTNATAANRLIEGKAAELRTANERVAAASAQSSQGASAVLAATKIAVDRYRALPLRK